MQLSEKELNNIAELITSKLINNFEKKGLVLAREELVRQAQLKEKILKKKWITFKEIANSNIWEVSSKGGVERIVKNEVDPDCIDKRKPPFKIHRSEVERIALNRGTI